MNFTNRCYAVGICKRSSDPTNFQNMYFYIIPNGKDYWVADPFPIEYNKELYIFGEVFEYRTLKGAIGYTKLEKNTFAPWKVIIREPYHLSFPNLIYKNDEIYMCPESHANKTLDLYKCLKFPDTWVKVKSLAENIDLVDTVFLSKNDCIYGIGCEWKSLKEHKMKLIKMSSKGIEISNGNLNTLEYYLTRPAGKIYCDENGKEYLVSQICRDRYGQGIVFKSFVIEWPDYIEKEEKRILPEDVNCNLHVKINGIHTFNVTENYVVIDVLWTRFNALEKMYRIKRKIQIK